MVIRPAWGRLYPSHGGLYGAVVVLLRLSWAALRGHSLRPSIAETRVYVRQLLAGRPPRSASHDPLGLWMVWLLWILVLLLGPTGWMARLAVSGATIL